MDRTQQVSERRQGTTTALGSAELRIISGAGHRLRHDPRALAILLGWLERQKNTSVGVATSEPRNR